MSEHDDHPDDSQRQSRRFAVSANRGRARHRVRYIESGGGDPDANCRVCSPMIAPDRPDADTDTAPTERRSMWDIRYDTDHYLYGTDPNEFLAEWSLGHDDWDVIEGSGHTGQDTVARRTP